MDQNTVSASNDGQTGLEGGLQQMKLQDCAYFLRTGSCDFGSKCRYNHPTVEKMQAALPYNSIQELPERPGQMECQFFIKTGTCKFGPACWYHHPRQNNGLDGGGDGQVKLNFLGLPLRPGEKDCAYYVQTGSCKYGGKCRFHHPQPTTTESVMPSPNSSMNSLNRVAPMPYQDPVPAWPVARAPFMPSAMTMPRPPNFAPILVSSPQPIPLTGPIPYKHQGHTSQMPPDDRGAQSAPRGITCGYSQEHLTTAAGVKGFNSPIAIPKATFSHGQTIFPERPGQPDCHHYMKTGDCKFGMNCKYHHPKDRAMSVPSGLNPMGLPLRPGKPTCPYYSRHGICKFGPVCKFDHPVNIPPYSPPYSPSMSSLNEIPVAPFVPESASISPGSTSSNGQHSALKMDKAQKSTSDKPNVQLAGNGNTQDCNSFD
eukprot:c23206_g1_i1 orf=102-1382(+)